MIKYAKIAIITLATTFSSAHAADTEQATGTEKACNLIWNLKDHVENPQNSSPCDSAKAMCEDIKKLMKENKLPPDLAKDKKGVEAFILQHCP